MGISGEENEQNFYFDRNVTVMKDLEDYNNDC